MYRCSAGDGEDRFGFKREIQDSFGVNFLELKTDQFTDSKNITQLIREKAFPRRIKLEVQ